MTKQSHSTSAHNPQFPSGDNPTRRAVVAGVASAVPAAALAAAAIPAVASPTTGETVMNAFTKIQNADHSPLGDMKPDRMLELVMELRESEKIEATDDLPDPSSPVMRKVVNEGPAVTSREGALAAVEHLLTDIDELGLLFEDGDECYEHMHFIMLSAVRDYLARR